MVVIAEVAGGDNGADVDGVESVDLAQIENQTWRPVMPDGPYEGAAQVDRVIRVEQTARLYDKGAV